MARPFCIPYQFRVVSRKRFHPLPAFLNGLTWSADDKKVIYSRYRTVNGNLTAELGEVTVANGSTKQLAVAGSAMLPTVSPRGDKLAYSSLSTNFNTWRRDLLHPESPAIELIPSSRLQFDAQYSPDGKRIAFASLRSGSRVYGSAATMEATWYRSRTLKMRVAVRNGRRTETR